MAYVKPTSWTSGGMDWTAPDASNPMYIDAIWGAYTERAVLAGLYGHNIWQGGMVGFRPMRYGWAQDLASKILALSSSFYVINTDASTKVATPYLSVYSQIQTDDELKNLSVSAGDLLSGSRSAAFLKSAKHFLDLMTIVQRSTTWPTLITGSLWATTRDDFPDDYEPADTGSWAAFLADSISYKTSEDYTWTEEINSMIRCLSLSRGISAPVSLVYHQNKRLAHNFLMQVYAVTTDPPSYYIRPWDWLGLSVAHGDIITTAVARDASTVAIGGDTPIAPASPLNYPYPPAYDGGPMYNNTQYLMRFRNFAYDFGVEGGLQFYTTED